MQEKEQVASEKEAGCGSDTRSLPYPVSALIPVYLHHHRGETSIPLSGNARRDASTRRNPSDSRVGKWARLKENGGSGRN
ncbi:hypothetical protein H6P81_014023 [Aristolochia fimbriata]|uniref:Uncharacterized protein n=1 Tax=Aristolochia fimbriata TaxID=158543 RepID=A0AAV7EII5_ARIFI|nr:hypothetical protein H6P81_014023 [Aristolochia fimbriata]